MEFKSLFWLIRKNLRNLIFITSGKIFWPEICQRSKIVKKMIELYGRFIFKLDPDRRKQEQFEKLNPDLPWFVPESTLYIEWLLKPDFVWFEWWSWRSTIWFAKRVKHITSIESRKSWYVLISDKINEEKLQDKISYNLAEVINEYWFTTKDIILYTSKIDSIVDKSLDFVIVDGLFRVECIKRCLSKIRPGGIIIFDNSDLPEFKKVHVLFKSLNSKTFTNWIWETTIFFSKKDNGFDDFIGVI